MSSATSMHSARSSISHSSSRTGIETLAEHSYPTQAPFATNRSDLRLAHGSSNTTPRAAGSVLPTTADASRDNNEQNQLGSKTSYYDPMILGSRRPIHCRYAGALSSSKQKLIALHGKWCYTRTERALAEHGMIELCAQADIYKERMDSFLNQRSAYVASKRDPGGDDSEDQNRLALFDAEWTFAEQCFLELSRQASAYELRLRRINAAQGLLSLERDQLYPQIDAEMRAGQLAQGVHKDNLERFYTIPEISGQPCASGWFPDFGPFAVIGPLNLPSNMQFYV